MARLTGTGPHRPPGRLWPRYFCEIIRDGNTDGGCYYGQDTAKLVAQSLATATGKPVRVTSMPHANAKARQFVCQVEPQALDG